ncbi:TPA: hypothetical protein ACT2IN_001602, partial [Streptococcus suis]
NRFLFLCPEKEKIETEKKKVRATRTNGRKDSNGVFKAGHNDRSFNLENAEHVMLTGANGMFIGIICKDITLRMKMECDRKENIYLMKLNTFIITNNSEIP